MARVADYVILQDNWKVETAANSPVKFTVPSNIHPGSRSVLTFMFKVDTSGDAVLKIEINGTEVWVWQATGSVERPAHCVQEVVDANILKPGENILKWHSKGDWRVTQLSDIVLWVQVET